MIVKAVDADFLDKRSYSDILRIESESLIAHLFAASPVDQDEMRQKWKWEIAGLKSMISNATPYLPFVRAYYIENQGVDFINDIAAEWAAGKPRRAPLRPMILFDFVFTDFVFRPGYVSFRMKPPEEGLNISRWQWERQSKALLRYFREIQPVDTAFMQGNWKLIFEGNSVVFVNTTRYMVYVRAYYMGIRFKDGRRTYSGQPYDFIMDAINDFMARKPIRSRLIPRGRFL